MTETWAGVALGLALRLLLVIEFAIRSTPVSGSPIQPAFKPDDDTP